MPASRRYESGIISMSCSKRIPTGLFSIMAMGPGVASPSPPISWATCKFFSGFTCLTRSFTRVTLFSNSCLLWIASIPRWFRKSPRRDLPKPSDMDAGRAFFLPALLSVASRMSPAMVSRPASMSVASATASSLAPARSSQVTMEGISFTFTTPRTVWCPMWANAMSPRTSCLLRADTAAGSSKTVDPVSSLCRLSASSLEDKTSPRHRVLATGPVLGSLANSLAATP
mmetsp:Transcript_17291/g.46132  ORF Transcript_17291/g.46132 Transcript_17291/m.46132 type:complete len:228 (+) Transcript_17291:357-1040(+)